MEVGPRDMAKGEYVLVERTDRSQRVPVGRAELEVKVRETLDKIQQKLFDRYRTATRAHTHAHAHTHTQCSRIHNTSCSLCVMYRAKVDLDEGVVVVSDWEGVCNALDNMKLLLAPYCEQTCCEDLFKKESAR